jgi:tagaturonate reductase
MTNLDSISLVQKKKRPVKVLQFGTGNFLRGFADWMIEILNEKTDFDGSIHIIQSHGKSIPEDFVKQNYNYHVFVRGFQRWQNHR